MSILGRLLDRTLSLAAERFLREWNRQHTHPVHLIQEAMAREAASYIAEQGDGVLYVDRKHLMLDALRHSAASGLVLEFGVNRGQSIRWIAEAVRPRPVHGFDSFEGLPSGGAGTLWRKHQFDQGGRLPDVPANVVLHKGWFQDTLPAFLSTAPQDMVAFVHIDCDLYDSTKLVLEALESRLTVGSVLMFDEYFNFPNWRQHEFRAFHEFLARKGLGYRYIGFSRNQAAVILE